MKLLIRSLAALAIIKGKTPTKVHHVVYQLFHLAERGCLNADSCSGFDHPILNLGRVGVALMTVAGALEGHRLEGRSGHAKGRRNVPHTLSLSHTEVFA